MNKNLVNWLIFGALSIIWGSSFILMKISLDNHLGPYQIASLRIVFAGLVLLPITIKNIKYIPRNKFFLVFISGTLGSLLPAFLFCLAEEGIESSLAGTLNCLTPIFAIITGAVFYKTSVSVNKIAGILIAFVGSVLLLFSKGHLQENQDLIFISFVVLAAFLYGFNVNMVSKHLLMIPPLHLAAMSLSLNAIPALLLLISTGFFNLSFAHHPLLIAVGGAAFLGIIGTAFASVLFYTLVKRAGGIFASMVTYGIPFVAIIWGFLYGELIGLLQILSLLLILLGVYWANRKISANK